MKIISIIDESSAIGKILKQLKLWDIKIHDPPVSQPVNFGEQTYDDSFSQILPENEEYWIL